MLLIDCKTYLNEQKWNYKDEHWKNYEEEKKHVTCWKEIDEKDHVFVIWIKKCTLVMLTGF